MDDWKRVLLANRPVAAINAAVKAALMEHEAASIVRRYGNDAIPADPSAASLKRRLGDRPSRLGWPKSAGELHLFLGFGVHNWEEVLPYALRPLGRVSAFDYAALGYDPGAPDWLDRRDEMNGALLDAFDRANSQQPVDVFIGYLSGRTVAPETLTEIASRGAAVVNFGFDDKVGYPGRRLGGRYISTAAIASAVDLNLTSDPKGAGKYAAFGGLSMFHPEAADPEVHRPHDTPFQYDVSFIGARYGWRPKFIADLESLGVSVTCFGKGWPNGPVSTEEMPAIYSASRINLGFGGIGYSRRLVNLKGRDFEVPMSGGLYLTQDNPELHDVYDVGKEILTYRRESDCAETIRSLLADPAMAHDIRSRGLARARRDHSYVARWEKVLRILGALAPNEP